MLATIAATGAQPSQFTFEITEKAFAKDATTVLENVLRLRMNGCGIAVDDFGTGYSSLQQLNRTPITELKLDRSFVRRITTNSKALSIVESTIELAAKLNLKTVAEGDRHRRNSAIAWRSSAATWARATCSRKAMDATRCRPGRASAWSSPRDASVRRIARVRVISCDGKFRIA